MWTLSVKKFLRLSLFVSLILALVVCATLAYFMAENEYFRVLQSTRTSKQSEIIELQAQIENELQRLKDQLLKAHQLHQEGPEESKLSEIIQSISDKNPVTQVKHELILLNRFTKRNIFRAFQAYLSGKEQIPTLRRRSRKCFRDKGIVSQLNSMSLKLGVDVKNQKIWLSGTDWDRLDLLDGLADGVLDADDYLECIKDTIMPFHFDSFVHRKVDDKQIRDFWLRVMDDRPDSIADLLEYQSRELPELFNTFSYLDFVLVAYALSESIALTPKGTLYENFLKRKLEIEPIKVTRGFIEIQDHWVYLQLYNRPWPNKPENVKSVIADGVSLLKLSKQSVRTNFLQKLTKLGFEVEADFHVAAQVKVFSALLGKNLIWKGWNQLQEWQNIWYHWLMILALLFGIHILLFLFSWIWLIKPLERSIQDLLNGTSLIESNSMPQELKEVQMALRQMNSNRTSFEKEMIFRSASLNILQNSSYSIDEIIDQIKTLFESLFEGACIEKLETRVKRAQMIKILPTEIVIANLEKQLKLKFPIYFLIRSKQNMPNNVLVACAEILEKMYLSLHIHTLENLFQERTKDIDTTEQFSQFSIGSKCFIYAGLKIDLKVNFRDGLSGYGYEILEHQEGLYILMVQTHCMPPNSTILTHALRSYLHGVASLNNDMQSLFDRLCSYSFEMNRDTGIEQSFTLINISPDRLSIEYISNDIMGNESRISESGWQANSSNDLIRAVPIQAGLQFKSTISENNIQLIISLESESNA